MTIVTDWYNGQTILVTGGTGFMGKVLLEKLLRTCPGIKCIYVLVRPKRGLEPSVRIEEIVKLPVCITKNYLLVSRKVTIISELMHNCCLMKFKF